MSRALVISVHLHEGRYHGSPEWPPAPARLFQALVAAAAVGESISSECIAALTWLETLDPPVIASPVVKQGQAVKLYMPNNDLDAVARDPRRIAEIRTATKIIRPRLFDVRTPWLYSWTVAANEQYESEIQVICALAWQLYRFGRGVDMAWAYGEVMAQAEIDARLSSYPGMVSRPSRGSSDFVLACPEEGSLASLRTRHEEGQRRFRPERHDDIARRLFSKPPEARFANVAYDCPPSRRLYELRSGTGNDSFRVWPLTEASRLVEWLRDGAVARLRRALPDRSTEIERVMIGRKADGADAAPANSRVCIVPLPSIGHHHADRGIRRILVEVPSICPLVAGDVHWAFSGLELADPETGEVMDMVLTPSADESMRLHYGAGGRRGFRFWRTVTPAALPASAQRRRVEPTRLAAEMKWGAERADEHHRAAAAVTQALRHVGVRAHADLIRVQREPFEDNGARVEPFAERTRFTKERLWHVEIAFSEPIRGPLVIGDGRFLGLGVMAPQRRAQGVYAFTIENGLIQITQTIAIAHALRRAVMARVQDKLGRRSPLPAFFTGHQHDGSPAQTERDPHLTFVFDPAGVRLLIVAPHLLENSDPKPWEREQLNILDDALTHFHELRAGAAGLLTLRTSEVCFDSDPLFAPSRIWETATAYQVTRHSKHVGAAEALAFDLRTECRRRGLPEAHVTPLETRGVPGVGLSGRARLTFKVAVPGPIILGRSRHLGGGLFAGAPPESRKTIDGS